MSNHIADDGDLQAPPSEIVPIAPEVLPPNLDAPPPREMRNKKQWVVWKLEWIEGKWKKPPYHPRSGRRLIGSTAHGEMGTYDEALRAYQRGGYSGIGYCLRENDNLVVIDYDDCRDPATGLLLRSAQALVNATKSRTEASPLGTGIHIWSYGNIGRNRKDGNVEMYKNNQYITWTGHLLPNTPAEIAYRLQDGENYWSIAHIYEEFFAQQLLRESRRENTGGGEASDLAWPAPFPLSEEQRAALQRSDERLIERIKQSKNGERFEHLWNAEERDANGGLHGGDFALILILLYWTNDDILWTDRLFRQSARMRDKWDRLMVRYTYGQATIYRALTRRYGLDRNRDRRPAPVPVRNQTTEPAAPERETGEQAPTPAPASTPTPQRRARREVQFLEYEIPEAEQRIEETPEGRASYLNGISRNLQAQAQAILTEARRQTTALLAPPGVGKSHVIAMLGEMSTSYPRGLNDLAWIAERHEMIESVPALRHYHHIEACTRFNCSDHELHQALGARGYNTWSLHSQHNQPCDYMQQFRQKGSAVFQLPHVRTKYPTQHQGGIIIDELDLPKWLPERVITNDMLQRIRIAEGEESAVSHFAQALQEAFIAVGRTRHVTHGKGLFDLIDQTSGHTFYDLFIQLRNDSRFTNTRPMVNVDPYDHEALEKVEALPPVVLPHIINAFDRELLRWNQGQGAEWNSYLRIGPYGRGSAALYITEPLTFGEDENYPLPDRIVLDATADEMLLQLLLKDEHVEIKRARVTPPRSMLHVAVRTGKRYGKRALCAIRHDPDGNEKENPDLIRVISECRFLLSRYDIDGSKIKAGKVGIISFMTCVDKIAEALGIPETVPFTNEQGEVIQRKRRGHFWNMRGSNALEDCEILLVIGTPTLRPEEIERLGRALWHDDPVPIDPTCNKDEETGTWLYADKRLERLNAYLTRAELTQCAHRSRALRHQDRIVITLCKSPIDFLPIRHEFLAIPQLKQDGRVAWEVSREEEAQRLEAARQRLTERSVPVTVRSLQAEAAISRTAAQEYLRRLRESEQQTETQRIQQEAPPPSVLYHEYEEENDVPDNAVIDTTWEVGYNEIPVVVPRELDPEEIFMQYGRTHGYPALMVEGIFISASLRSWSRFAWMPGPTNEQRAAVYSAVAALAEGTVTPVEVPPPAPPAAQESSEAAFRALVEEICAPFLVDGATLTISRRDQAS